MNLAPHYRAPLWRVLLNNPGWNMHFFYGDHANVVETIDFEREGLSLNSKQIHKVKNYWWKGTVLIWQKGVIRECMKSQFEFAVFPGEMSRLSTWVAAIICRLRGVKVVFWEHGLYGNEKGFRLILKKAFFSLAHKHLLYERRAKKLMIEHGFAPDNLYVFFNSLDYDVHKVLRHKLQALDKKDVFPFFTNPYLPVVIFIGRLTGVKKLDLLLQAVNQINDKQTDVNLLIVGDGAHKNSLEEQGRAGIQNGWLYFAGACYDEEKNGRYLSMSDLCVSPGNVGLTAIHSLSFGTPVCTHDNMYHQMPESGAIQAGHNGFFFKENDAKDLKVKIEDWLNLMDRRQVRKNSYEIIDKYYNPHYQLTVFNRLVSGESPEL